MTTGCTARVAVSPSAVLAFLDIKTDYTFGGRPARMRRTINRQPVGQGNAARTIRRLRSGRFTTMTEPAARRLLGEFNLTIDELRRWAEAKGHAAFVRE